jgi:RHH-type transcriptional regulator, proline utilization regulon repressor / proline dehydrogenase / delta 1-pyrroline-5-carboxylate dehydrogenase
MAAMRAESNFTVSVPASIGERYIWALQATGIRVDQRSDESWFAGLNEMDLTNGRIRLIGGSAAQVTSVTGGRPDLAVYAGPVLLAGRIEMLPFLREQAISITAHRFGTPNHLSDALI